MKPENWDKLCKEEKVEIAKGLFVSPRGRYIISQALCEAIKAMNKVPSPQKEVSNIQDMEILGELFPICFVLDKITWKKNK